MIERDDRRGFGQPVALDDREAQLAPERLELAFERRRADDEAQNLNPNADGSAGSATSARRSAASAPASASSGASAQHVLAQHVENLRHRHQHRDAPALDLRDDVARVVAAHEDDDARQHRRDEGRHRLAEHVAERQQVQEAQREERRAPLAVLQDLAFDRHDVRQHVAVGDDDALGLGGRARREDDLGDVVAPDGNLRGRARGRDERRPVELVQLPRSARRRCRGTGGTSCPTSTSLRLHDPRDAGEKVGRRAVVDRHDDDAVQQAAPERDDPLGAVLGEEDDLVAFAQAGGMQAAPRIRARRAPTSW